MSGIGTGMRNPKEYNENIWSNATISGTFEKNWNGILNSIEFGEGETVMDSGCGPGSFFIKFVSQIAQEKKLKLIGVDISEVMTEYAKRHSNIPGVTEYVVGNILQENNWPFLKGTFDKIFASNVIQSMENYNRVELYQQSFPHPQFSITLLAAHPFWSNNYECGGSKYWGSWVWSDSLKGKMPNFELALLSSGFRIKEYHHYSVTRVYRDIRECLGFLILANGPLSSIEVGSELYEKLVKDLIDNAKDLFGIDVEAKPFRYKFNIYWFTAQKVKDN